MSHTKALHDQSVLKLTSPSLTTDGYYVLQFQANVAEGGVWSVGWFFFSPKLDVFFLRKEILSYSKNKGTTPMCVEWKVDGRRLNMYRTHSLKNNNEAHSEIQNESLLIETGSN